MLPALCTYGEAAVDSGDETDYPFNDEQQYQNNFRAWLQSLGPLSFEACVRAGSAEPISGVGVGQLRKVSLSSSMGAFGIGPRQISRQVTPGFGDAAVDDTLKTPVEFNEAGQVAIECFDCKQHAQPTQVDALDEEEKVNEREGKNEVDTETKVPFEDAECFREFNAMLAEDLQSWCMRESLLKSPASFPSSFSSRSSSSRSSCSSSRS